MPPEFRSDATEKILNGSISKENGRSDGAVIDLGLFRLTTRALFYRGERVQIAPKPLDLLRELMREPGRVYSRQEIARALWPDTNVVSNNLDKQVGTLRKVLGSLKGEERGDAHACSIDIETVPHQGLRLVFRPGSEPAPLDEERAVSTSPQPVHHFRSRLLLGLGAIACLGLIVGVVLYRRARAPNLVEVRQITHDGIEKYGPLFVRDSKVYYTARSPANSLREVSVAPLAGGKTQRLLLGVNGLAMDDAGRELLSEEADQRLFRRPLEGGSKQQVPGIAGLDAVAYVTASDLAVGAVGSEVFWFSLRSGSILRRIKVPLEQSMLIRGIRYSADLQKYRLLAVDVPSETTAIWEMGPNGENARPVISAAGGWNSDFCWAKGGKWFVVSYVVGTSDAAGKLFAFREPVAPNSTFADAKLLAKDDFVRWTGPASDGGKLYAIGELLRKEAVVWDSKTGALSTYMQGVPANEIAYSPDGLWVAYTDAADDSLWKMRVDGSASFRLTPAGMKAYGAHWSPQGKQIAFMGSLSNQQYLAYTIPVAGGAVSPIHRDSLAQGIPSWSPDGRFVVYGERTLEKAPARMRIHMVDTRTGRETEIPGSAGKWTARWSPDGRFIAAQSAASDQLFLYDVASERWSELVSMPNDNLFWSSNSQSIFFASRDATTMTVYRVNVRDRRINHVVDFPRESNMEPILAGVTPDDKEILHRKVISSDVYELNVQWP